MNRKLLFWGVCIVVRSAIAAGAVAFDMYKKRQLWQRVVVALIAITAAVGLLANFIKKKPSGFFKGVAWWHIFRPVHAIIYLMYAVLLISNIKGGSGLLVADVALAVTVGAMHVK